MYEQEDVVTRVRWVSRLGARDFSSDAGEPIALLEDVHLLHDEVLVRIGAELQLEQLRLLEVALSMAVRDADGDLAIREYAESVDADVAFSPESIGCGRIRNVLPVGREPDGHPHVASVGRSNGTRRPRERVVRLEVNWTGLLVAVAVAVAAVAPVVAPAVVVVAAVPVAVQPRPRASRGHRPRRCLALRTRTPRPAGVGDRARGTCAATSDSSQRTRGTTGDQRGQPPDP